MHPQKIYAELTTRCNLLCAKCVKQAPGSEIAEEDMPLEIFEHLLPALEHADTLVVNGIGEPLLHPQLTDIIALARAAMPPGGRIGFQSNGLLLGDRRCEELIETGLSTICLSVDSMQPSQVACAARFDHSFATVSTAVAALARARKAAAKDFNIGLEIVLRQDTVADLPDLVRWAGHNGVEYIIATHLIPYDGASAEKVLFNPNSAEAVRLFARYQQLAGNQGIDMAESFSIFRKFAGTRSSAAERQLFAAMQEEAGALDIPLNIHALLAHQGRRLDWSEALLAQAGDIAASLGIALFLPPLQALHRRSCIFQEEKAVFIAASGDVMPCHFLWHTYRCRFLQDDIHVRQRVFGNIREQSLDAIWRSAEYSGFRDEVCRYDFSPCWSCPMAPCPSLVDDDSGTANDCYGSRVPCGHCQWSLGGLRCL